MTSVIDQQHTKITLGLVITIIGAVAGGAYWMGEIDSRVSRLEDTTKAQWQKLSSVERIAQDVAVIKAAVTRLERE